MWEAAACTNERRTGAGVGCEREDKWCFSRIVQDWLRWRSCLLLSHVITRSLFYPSSGSFPRLGPFNTPAANCKGYFWCTITDVLWNKVSVCWPAFYTRAVKHTRTHTQTAHSCRSARGWLRAAPCTCLRTSGGHSFNMILGRGKWSKSRCRCINCPHTWLTHRHTHTQTDSCSHQPQSIKLSSSVSLTHARRLRRTSGGEECTLTSGSDSPDTRLNTNLTRNATQIHTVRVSGVCTEMQLLHSR